jgi:hypothetical protein
MDTMKPDPERLELAALVKGPKGPYFVTLSNEEVQAILNDIAAQLEAEAALNAPTS